MSATRVLRLASRVLLLSGAAGACASGAPREAERTLIAPTLLAPRGLLTSVTKLALAVLDATTGVECDAATGKITGLAADAKPVASTELATSGCGAGVRFCGTLEISRTTAARVFRATGFVGAVEHAVGCAKATVDQEALALEIKMVRSVAPAVCGDGALQPTEQCEPSGVTDPVCDSDCQSKEVYLSGGTTAAGTVSGRPGEKTAPFFLWPARGRFVAFFADRSPPSQEVTMRVLNDAYGPYKDQGVAVQDGSFFLPNARGGVVGQAEANDQTAPTAASIGTSTFVVFQDNNRAKSWDVHLRSLDSSLAAGEGVGNAVGINGTAPDGEGEDGVQSAPQVAAGPGGVLYVVWQDEGGGKVVGRTWNPTGRALGPQAEVAAGARRPRVAATPNGWLVVYESGTDVKVRTIGANGAPTGSEQTVSEPSHRGGQEQPTIAALGDGRFAVAWTDRGATGGADIFLQRYSADAKKVAGDQVTPVNDVVLAGDQTTPAIAAMSAAGGAFAIAWIDEGSGHVRTRLAGGGRDYLFNNVNGQPSEFQASVEGRRTRGNPTLAVGGAGPFIAVGWEDRTGDARAGIYGRRFPVPAE